VDVRPRRLDRGFVISARNPAKRRALRFRGCLPLGFGLARCLTLGGLYIDRIDGWRPIQQVARLVGLLARPLQ
jgi:hypothetical protein